MMPTAGKLVAAVSFAVGGYIISDMVRPLLPEGTRTGMLVVVCVLVPLICGWRVLGKRLGDGYRAALNSGVYGVFVSLAFVFFFFSSGEMIRRSMQKRYDGVMEALTGIFEIALYYSVVLLSPAVWGVLAATAVIGAVLSEWAFRRWQ